MFQEGPALEALFKMRSLPAELVVLIDEFLDFLVRGARLFEGLAGALAQGPHLVQEGHVGAIGSRIVLPGHQSVDLEAVPSLNVLGDAVRRRVVVGLQESKQLSTLDLEQLDAHAVDLLDSLWHGLVRPRPHRLERLR